MLQAVKSDAANVCCMLFSLSAFPRRINVHAAICAILYGFCFKTTHSSMFVAEREKGKAK